MHDWSKVIERRGSAPEIVDDGIRAQVAQQRKAVANRHAQDEKSVHFTLLRAGCASAVYDFTNAGTAAVAAPADATNLIRG